MTAVGGHERPRGLTIADLERWVLFGAKWRIVEISDAHVTLDLCECTGRLVECRESDDAMLIEYARSARGRVDDDE